MKTQWSFCAERIFKLMFFRNLRDFRVAWAFLRDWWYFPPGQTTVLAIHQGLPYFFQAYLWWTKSLHHLDLIANYNGINPIFSSPCHLMIHQIYLLHWGGVDLNLNIYIYYVCIVYPLYIRLNLEIPTHRTKMRFEDSPLGIRGAQVEGGK